jgi:hypothetical protein
MSFIKTKKLPFEPLNPKPLYLVVTTLKKFSQQQRIFHTTQRISSSAPYVILDGQNWRKKSENMLV